MVDQQLLDKWITHVFDHPAEEVPWYFFDQVREVPWYCEFRSPRWEDRPEEIAELIAETFERSGELLGRFSNEQLVQAFSFLIPNLDSEYISVLVDPRVPWELRRRALWSFVPLFEQIMAKRCTEGMDNPLNETCFMWWDNLHPYDYQTPTARPEYDEEVPKVLGRLLAIDQKACRHSALHGCGEWVKDNPLAQPEIAKIVDEFLERTPGLDPGLIEYANYAKIGEVL